MDGELPFFSSSSMFINQIPPRIRSKREASKVAQCTSFLLLPPPHNAKARWSTIPEMNDMPECQLCVYLATATGLCHICNIVRSWLPCVTHESEQYALRLTDNPNRWYWVYVLGTDLGSYVGHTNSVPRRLREHRSNSVGSTKGTDPYLQWQSRPLRSRKYADDMERVLKTLLEREHSDFYEITSVTPESAVEAIERIALAKLRLERPQRRRRRRQPKLMRLTPQRNSSNRDIWQSMQAEQQSATTGKGWGEWLSSLALILAIPLAIVVFRALGVCSQTP